MLFRTLVEVCNPFVYLHVLKEVHVLVSGSVRAVHHHVEPAAISEIEFAYGAREAVGSPPVRDRIRVDPS
ncbi:hypothetical protein GCM10009779_38080 [Polymorphospora rubra]